MNTLYVKMRRSTTAFILSFCGLTPLTSGQEYPTLIMNGESYQNACSFEEQKKLQDVLLTSSIRDASQAWRAIKTMLCAPDNDANRIYVTTLVPKKVRKRVDSTGDQPSFKIATRSEDLVRNIMAAGRAWDANIRLESAKVTVQYFSDEACVKQTTLAYLNGKWSVYEVGEACD